MRAIDLHVHPFTAEIVAKMPDWFWRHPRRVFAIEGRELSLDTLLADMDEAGVERAVLVAFDCETTYGFRVSNEDVAALVARHPDRFVGFASVDPNKGDRAVRELERAVRELGLRGLKLHPPTQHFYASDRAHYPLWAKAQELRIPVLCHTGHTFVGGYLKYAEPKFLDDVAADFPALKIVLCHFGFPWGLPETVARIRESLRECLALLRSIPPERWSRSGRHARRGEMTVDEIVEHFLLQHTEEHAAQAEAALRSPTSR